MELLNDETLKEAMEKVITVALSIGSFIQGVGAAAWIFEGTDKEGWYVGIASLLEKPLTKVHVVKQTGRAVWDDSHLQTHNSRILVRGASLHPNGL